MISLCLYKKGEVKHLAIPGKLASAPLGAKFSAIDNESSLDAAPAVRYSSCISCTCRKSDWAN